MSAQGCGRRILGDYTESAPGGLDRLQRMFDSMATRHTGQLRTTQNHTEKTESPHRGFFNSLVLSALRLLLSRPQQRSILPCHQGPKIITAVDPHQPTITDSKHLLLVLPHMKRGAKVQQPISDWILSDQGFFTSLLEQYQSARGRLRSIFSLRALVDMRFVKFDMYRSGLAQVRKIDDVPPPTMKDIYEYEPVDWSPPISPEHMLHLMEHPLEADEGLLLFKWVPKKLKEKLEASPKTRYCEGWGIQYIEGVDREKCCLAIFICGIISVVLSIAWSACQKDVQGGFAVGGTLFVILLAGIGSLEAMVGTRSSVQKIG